MDSTCYAEGSYNEVIYCSVAECGEKLSTTPKTIEKDPNNHEKTEFKYAVNAENATMHDVFYACCDAFKETVEHRYSEEVKVFEPTPERDSWKGQICDDCGYENVIEVYPNTRQIAKIETAEGDVIYTSVDAALKAAAAGQTVMLLTDVSWSGMLHNDKLDLNGHVLTVDDYLIALNDASVIDSSADNTGLLVVAEGVDLENVILPGNNPQLPVYGERAAADGAATADASEKLQGYMFVEITKYNKQKSGSKYIFQPIFEEVAFANLAKGMESSRVQFAVRVSCTKLALNEAGVLVERAKLKQDFIYTDDFVNTFATNYYFDAVKGWRNHKQFSFVLNTANLKDVKVEVVFISDLGVELTYPNW